MLYVNHNPTSVAPPEGLYSHAVELAPSSRILFISGQIPSCSDGSIPDAFDAQCHAVWDNIEAILASAEMRLEHLVKVTTFLSSPELADANGRICRERLGDLRPALTVVSAGLLDSKWRLEIEAVAAAPAASKRDP